MIVIIHLIAKVYIPLDANFYVLQNGVFIPFQFDVSKVPKVAFKSEQFIDFA